MNKTSPSYNHEVSSQSEMEDKQEGSEILTHRALKNGKIDPNLKLTEKINVGYLGLLLVVVAMGTFQYGYSIGILNTVFEPYKNVMGWDDDDGTLYQTLA
mmetsp:Transcript_4745/g.8117  ORF Transcript_4745/g.8117 Transcript_4745/m.8117 type:complete len:100 (-) Transcript_4745:1463-1762(-)